jgi:hypothetical protein
VRAANAEQAGGLRRRLDAWLKEVDAKLPLPDPEYRPEKQAAYLRRQEEVVMPRLEAQHAAYLDPAWQPNPDWWGSQVIRD